MSIWKNIFCVITSPRYGWEVINDSNIPVGKVMRTAFMPLLIVLALSCFVPMIYDRTLSFSGCLMSGIIHFSAYFISYYIIIYLLGGFYPELVKTFTAQRLHPCPLLQGVPAMDGLSRHRQPFCQEGESLQVCRDFFGIAAGSAFGSDGRFESFQH